MTNFKPLMKRVGAYVIDIFLVLTFASLITNSPILEKSMKSYRETYDEYATKYNEYADYVTLLDEYYQDDTINEEEYNKLLENETYKNIIISNYEDSEITEEEYKKILTTINDDFNEIAKEYVYTLNKKGTPNSIATLICTLLYFGIIQYLLKGQTLGKKLLKLKVVSSNDKKLNIFNYILRSLIVNDVLLNTISVIFLIVSSQKVYTQADNIIGILVSIVEATIIFMIFTREDKRGLHDILFNTKVISTNEPIDTQEIVAVETKKTIDTKEISEVKPKKTKKQKISN